LDSVSTKDDQPTTVQVTINKNRHADFQEGWRFTIHSVDGGSVPVYAGSTAAADSSDAEYKKQREAIYQVLIDKPFELTKTDAIEKVGGKAENVRAAWRRMELTDKIITSRKVPYVRKDGRKGERIVWGPTSIRLHSSPTKELHTTSA